MRCRPLFTPNYVLHLPPRNHNYIHKESCTEKFKRSSSRNWPTSSRRDYSKKNASSERRNALTSALATARRCLTSAPTITSGYPTIRASSRPPHAPCNSADSACRPCDSFAVRRTCTRISRPPSPASSGRTTRSFTAPVSTPTADSSSRSSASRTPSSPTLSTTPRSSTAYASARPNASAMLMRTWPTWSVA